MKFLSEVVISHCHRRFTGISATIKNLFPYQKKFHSICLFEISPILGEPTISWRDLLIQGWKKPKGKKVRIWHCRRNIEMWIGLFLKYVLCQPWYLIFTSAAPKRHSFPLRFLIDRMDAVVSTSARASSFLNRKSVIIPHGVDTGFFTPPESKNLCWKESGLSGQYGIGMFGRIRPTKGTDILIDALCQILPQFPDFTAVISGYCSPKYKAWYLDLRDKIAAFGLENRIVWLGDISREEIALWNRRVLLGLAPSLREGFGLTPLEAMASGAAVLTSQTGSFPEFIKEGKNGRSVKTGDRFAFTEALAKMLADIPALEKMGKWGRDFVCENYSIEKEAESLAQLYKKILNP